VDIAWRTPAGVGFYHSAEQIAEPGTAWTRTAPVEVHPTERDYSEQMLLFARLKSGTVRESQRVVHVVHAEPELLHSTVVAARCGTHLTAGDLQWLPRFSGMPCEQCVMATRD